MQLALRPGETGAWVSHPRFNFYARVPRRRRCRGGEGAGGWLPRAVEGRVSARLRVELRGNHDHRRERAWRLQHPLCGLDRAPLTWPAVFET
eukprot:5595581-Prymnesium_polylepis.1